MAFCINQLMRKTIDRTYKIHIYINTVYTKYNLIIITTIIY